MKIARSIMAAAIAIALVFSGALILAFADDGAPLLSGITVADEHPNGCVDCHKKSGDDDYRLNVSLMELDHPDITSIVKNLPGDCGMCHREGSKAGAISLQTHRIHYQNASENHFVTSYGGECLACHSLNVEDGVMTVKSGKANW